MELPKNITQIGEADKSCKVYAEDYVISYLKQLNRAAGDKDIAVALYGTRREEGGISYLFIYGAGKLNFLQRESRHLSQAVQQEIEKQRVRYFAEYSFLGYRLLNGEMVEGFHICEQGVCRYIAGYARFYEKNDSMLAYMLEERQESAVPEQVEQEKYDVVRKRQEERRQQAEQERGHAVRYDRHVREKSPTDRLRQMKFTAAVVFAVLCVAGLATINGGEKLDDLQVAARQMMEEISEQQLPDAVEVANTSPKAGTIVAEDKLTEAIQKENNDMTGQALESVPEATPEPMTQATVEPTTESAPQPTVEPIPEPTPEPTVVPTPEPTPEVTPESTPEPTPEPVSYTIGKGDTLIGICIARYGSDARVAEICSLNDIGNPDDIKVGQKILLP